MTQQSSQDNNMDMQPTDSNQVQRCEISIFEISLIADKICKYLGSSDLRKCLMVSKQWLSIFFKYFWESVDWVEIKNNCPEAGIRNSQLIKFLATGPLHTELLGDTGPTNLRSLEIARVVSQSRRDYWYYDFYLHNYYDGYEDPCSIDDQGFLVGNDDIEFQSEWSYHSSFEEDRDYLDESERTEEFSDNDKEENPGDLIEGDIYYVDLGNNEYDANEVYEEYEEYHQDDVISWPEESTLSLIKQNPHLNNLRIELSREIFPIFFGSRLSPDFSDSRHEDERSVLFALKNHPSITSLNIIPCYYGYAASWDVIIRHCPSETISDLRIQRMTRIHIDDRFMSEVEDGYDTRDETMQLPSHPSQWPDFPAMKTIGFYHSMNKAKTLILLELLKHCPNLERFDLDSDYRDPETNIFKAIREYCPKLESIRIWSGSDSMEELSHLLRSYPRLKNVDINGSDPTNSILPAILISSATIESITRRCPKHIPSATIAKVLSSCPNLRELNIYYSKWTKDGITLLDLVRTPWLSKQIKRLNFNIVFSGINPPLTQTEIMDLVIELNLKLEKIGDPYLWFRWSDNNIMTPEFYSALIDRGISKARMIYLNLIL